MTTTMNFSEIEPENMKIIDQTYTENKAKLQLLLNSTISRKDHLSAIMNQPTLKDAHIYCKIHNFSGQFSGPSIEKYIEKKYNMTKISASECNGDLRCNDTNIEIKVSNGGKENNKFNYVQLRMNHNCIYIFTAYYIHESNLDQLGELFIFKLDKDNIKEIVAKHGGYAHGTVGELGKITLENLNSENNQKEYALRPKYGDNCWKDLLQFRIDEIVV